MTDDARVCCSRSRENLLSQLQVFTGDSFPLRLLMFPEGTTVNQRSMEKCLEFAKKVMMAPVLHRARFLPGMSTPRQRKHPLRSLHRR